MAFVPTSGLAGDYVVRPDDEYGFNRMKWNRKNLTLFQALDEIEPPLKQPFGKPLRMPIQDVFSLPGVGTVVKGRVEFGTCKVGTNISIAPGNFQGDIKSVQMHK